MKAALDYAWWLLIGVTCGIEFAIVGTLLQAWARQS